MCILSAWS